MLLHGRSMPVGNHYYAKNTCAVTGVAAGGAGVECCVLSETIFIIHERSERYFYAALKNTHGPVNCICATSEEAVKDDLRCFVCCRIY